MTDLELAQRVFNDRLAQVDLVCGKHAQQIKNAVRNNAGPGGKALSRDGTELYRMYNAIGRMDMELARHGHNLYLRNEVAGGD